MKNLFKYLLLLSFAANAQGLVHDATFGTTGIVNTNLELYGTYLLENHKILAMTRDLKIIRFNEDGSRDTTFGINGECSLGDTYAYTGLYFNNGYIYYAGIGHSSSLSLQINKFDSDGHPVLNFGNNGVASYSINENSGSLRIEFTNDNKILLCGTKYTGMWNKLFIAKFNEDGSLDTSFQNNGFKEYYIFPIETKTIRNILPLTDGGFMFVCGGRVNRNLNYEQLAFAKIDSQGNLDTGFNGTGIKILPTMTYESLVNSKFSGTDALYVINRRSLNPDALLLKINLTNFTVDNTITIDFWTTDYIVNDDNSCITYGNDDYFSGYPIRDVHIKKYTPTGNPDPTFGSIRFELTDTDFESSNMNDLSGRIFMYDNKILISGNSELYHSTGPSHFLTVFNRFDLLPLSLGVDTPTIDNKIIITPNPVQNDLTISTNGLHYPITIAIYNQLGQLVNKYDYGNETDGALHIRTTDLPVSLYSVAITDGENKHYVKKFIKK